MTVGSSGSAGPGLRAVPETAETPEASTSQSVAPSARRAGEANRRPWILVLLLAAALVLGVGYVLERGRANALAGQVSSLESDLQTAQEGLRAANRRMGVVRTHVDDLAVRLGLLQEAVSETGETAEASPTLAAPE